MKMIKQTLLIFATVALLAACGGSKEEKSKSVSDAISEKIAEKMVESGTDIDVDSDKDGSVTIKKDGEEITFSSSESEIPEGFPEELLISDGKTVNSSVIKTGDGSLKAVTVETDASVEDIAAEINAKAKENGWESLMNMTSKDGGMLSFSKENNSLSVIISVNEGKKNEVLFNFTESDK